jgi:hypothetical protein
MKPEDKAVVQQALETFKKLPILAWTPESAHEIVAAMTALRQLLEQQEPVAWHDKIMGMEVSMDVSTGDDDIDHRVYGTVYEVIFQDDGGTPDVILAIETERNFTTPPAAQPAPVQEPDEWLTGCPECGMDSGCDCDSGTWNPPAQPAVPWSPALESVWGEPDHGDELTIAYMSGVHTGKKISKREWVGLTDEEVDALMGSPNVGFSYRNQYAIAFAKVIDAKLREKNGGAAQPADHTEQHLDMVRALERLLVVQDELCSVDHHGYCQSHYLDNVNHHGGCRVANARALVAKVRGKL